MLILLPPSEGKNKPAGRKSINLAGLVFPKELHEVRSRMLSQVLAKAPTAPAIEVYSGVLYQALDCGSLSSSAKLRGEKSVLIISAIFGVLHPQDQIPYFNA